jgi:ABC-type antimicrobial peptide transport system permease subunit
MSDNILDFAAYRAKKKYTQNEVEYLTGIGGTVGFILGVGFTLSIYALAYGLFWGHFSNPLTPPMPK